jgi:DNA-binding HxlR family transcriptional regulator
MTRTYGISDCPLAVTLDVIGDRWTLLLLRDLLLQGPRRFTDFQTAFPMVAPNTLSTRLKDMEENGLITRHLYNERPPRTEYELTPRGKSLGPVLKAMRDWGEVNVLSKQPVASTASKRRSRVGTKRE